MDVRDFDFDLPTELIAQEPPAARGASRLLHLDRASGALTHTTTPKLPALLRAGDLVVVNNTRVFPARLMGRRLPSGGAVECLLIRRVDDQRWEALMRLHRRTPAGTSPTCRTSRGLNVSAGQPRPQAFPANRARVHPT